MSDTKFNISGNPDEGKGREESDNSDFEFKIEKSKEELPAEQENKELDSSPDAPELTPKEEEKEEEITQEETQEVGLPAEEEITERSEAEPPLRGEQREEISQEVPENNSPDSGLEDIKPPGPEVELEGISKGFELKGVKFDEIWNKLKQAGKKLSLIQILYAAVALSVLINLFFALGMSSVKQKIKSNAILANQFALEKDQIREEKEELNLKAKELEKNVMLEKKVSSQVYDEKKKLEKELKDFKKRYYEEADGSLEKYTNEAKLMAKKVIAFSQAYQKDKKEYNKVITSNKQLKESLAELNKAMNALAQERLGQEAVFLYNLGVAYARGGLYDEAIKAFNDSLAQASDNPEAHYNLAVIYETIKGDNAKTIKHLEQYLKSVPDTIERYQLEVKIDSLKRVLLKRKKYPISDSLPDFTD